MTIGANGMIQKGPQGDKPDSYTAVTDMKDVPFLTRDEELALQVSKLADENQECSDTSSVSEIERETWSGRFEALLSYIGYCVGLGNIWRFPYLCYRNGGGAFLIPYFLMLILAGLPLYFIELGLGQYSGLGPAKCWTLAPIFKGVGYCSILCSALCSVYYNQLIAYALLYLFHSMKSQVPWATCGNEWNTEACMEASLFNQNSNETMNATVLTGYNDTVGLEANLSISLTSNKSLIRVTPAEEFWERKILKQSSGIEDLVGLDLHLSLALLLAWIIIFLVLIKGIKSTGKVVYVTATLPYVALLILFIRGVTLPGAAQGLYFYLCPDFERLKNPRVWGEAASQIFYSLGPCWGMIITYASYHKFKHNYIRDAIITSFACTGSSVFAGLVIFSVVGFMAHTMQQDISTVVKAGPGLVFVAYPEALAQMPIAPLWSVLFFVMVLTVAIDSMFCTFEVVIVMLLDEFPSLLRYRVWVTASFCVVYFFIALPQATHGGIYILTLFDWYVGTFPPLVASFMECAIIAYIYGYSNFERDVRAMTGVKPSLYWKATCCFITPAVILFIIIFNAVIFKPVHYGDYEYPPWAQVLGIVVTLTPCSCVVIFGIGVYVHKTKGKFLGCRETYELLFKPEPAWRKREKAYLLTQSSTTNSSESDQDSLAKDNSGKFEITNNPEEKLQMIS